MIRIRREPAGVAAAVAFIAPALFAHAGAHAQLPLPILGTFENDAPSAPPPTGGADQPTAVVTSGGASATVFEPSFPLNDDTIQSRHLRLVAPSSGNASVRYSTTDPVASASVIRHEVTIALADTAATPLLELTAASIPLLSADASGDLLFLGAQAIGTYTPGSAFRVRVDVAPPMGGLPFAGVEVSIDDEMNGFADDASSQSVVPVPLYLGFQLMCDPTGGSADVAFDNVLITLDTVRSTIDWSDPAGGTWSDGSNWTGGSPPSPIDIARFDLPAQALSVTLSGGEAACAIEVRDGDVSVATLGNDLFVTGFDSPFDEVIIGAGAGDVAALRVSGGGAIRSATVGNGAFSNPGRWVVGRDAGSTGVLEIDGSDLRLLDRDLVIGDQGAGALIVRNGAVLQLRGWFLDPIGFPPEGTFPQLVVGPNGSVLIDNASLNADTLSGTITAVNGSVLSGIAADGSFDLAQSSMSTTFGISGLLELDGSHADAGIGGFSGGATLANGSTLTSGDSTFDGLGGNILLDASTASAALVTGDVTLRNASVLNADELDFGARVQGTGSIDAYFTGEVLNRDAQIAPGENGTFGLLTVQSPYRQTGGRLEIAVGGAGSPGVDFDQLAVQDAVSIGGGGLIVSFADGFVPPTDQPFAPDVLTAVSLTGRFSVARVPGLIDGRFVRVDYAEALTGGAVTLAVAPLGASVTLQAPEQFPVPGAPTDAAAGDLDGDTLPDLVLAVPDPNDPGAPGSVLVLFNQGVAAGVWQGFSSGLQFPVGVGPSAVDVADLDGAGGLDVVVANAGDGALGVLTNPGGGLLDAQQIVATGFANPRDVRAAQLDASGLLDLVVADTDNDQVVALESVGMLMYVTCDIPTGPRPNSVDPFDDDDDGRASIAVANAGAGTSAGGVGDSVTLIDNSPGGFVPQPNAPVGQTPVQVLARDLDGDGLSEVITANLNDGSVSVIPNVGGALGAAVQVPVDDAVLALAVLDIDQDPQARADIAVVSADDGGVRSVQSLINVTENQGQIVLLEPSVIDAGLDPFIVLSSDVDGDDRDDLVTLNAPGTRGIGSQVGVTRNPVCPADLTTTGAPPSGPLEGVPDGVTDLSDLLFFVNLWNGDIGTPSQNPDSRADVTTTGGANPGVPDGNVDLSDILYFINEWNSGLTVCP